MNYKYYIADVFTNRIFNGAQVAVFPGADGLNDEQMAKVARELNLSETVFLFKKDQTDKSRRMRTFSPYGEKGFAGHPVVAAAFVSTSCGELELTERYTRFTFEQNAGPVEVNVTGVDGKPVFSEFVISDNLRASLNVL